MALCVLLIEMGPLAVVEVDSGWERMAPRLRKASGRLGMLLGIRILRLEDSLEAVAGMLCGADDLMFFRPVMRSTIAGNM